jgi:transglutaminase-like putative cysteine protease
VIFGPRNRRVPVRIPSPQMSPTQVRWLGALLIAVQLPQVAYVPVWVAVTGLLLVGARLMMVRNVGQESRAHKLAAKSWFLGLVAVLAALAIRQSFGYFLGRDPCVAFLFVLVGIKFIETRTARDGTLLVCLACFLMVTPFFYSESLLATAAALPAMLMLGVVLQALARPPSAPPFPSWRAPLRATLVMLLQGIPLAAMLFVLFPRVSGPLWGVPADHSAKTGLSDRMAPGLISQLSLSDSVAFRVDFRGPVPPAWLRYWRGPVLSSFDGRTWSMGPRRSDGLLSRGDESSLVYTVTLEPHWRHWLFALDLPASLPQITMGTDAIMRNEADAVLTRDQQLIARRDITRALSYVQTSVLEDSYPAGDARRLATDIAENTRLPATPAQGNPRTIAFARELRRSYPDDGSYVRAVLDHFRREPFFYTLEPPLLGDNPVDGFLFETRRGFCEHYASTFAVLLRAAGVPARVVTGYQGGELNPNGDYMIVRQSDAHAWAEALIDGRWQRFDPTAAVAPSRIQLGLGGALPAGEPVPLLARLDSSLLRELQLAWDAINHGWRRHVVGFNYERQRSMWQNLAIDHVEPWQIVATVAGAALFWSALLLGWLAWRNRREDRVRAVWDGLCVRLARAGLPRAAHEGPLAFAARAAGRWPEFAAAFGVIGESYAALRYGPPTARQPDARGRLPALARLERAIAVLPSPKSLRSAPLPGA